MLPRIALALTLAALLLAGCTSAPPETAPSPGYEDGDTSATNTTRNETAPGNETYPGNETTPPPLGGEADVAIIDNQFDPNETSVAAGGSLTFRNDGKALHSVTIQQESGEPRVDQDVPPGESVTVDFGEPGTYLLRCKYHSTDFQTGQTGIITVT